MTHHPRALPWLLEKDVTGIRYLVLRDLVGQPAEKSELEHAKEAAYTRGQIAEVLGQMRPEGYWRKSGAGYNPKYTSTVWSLILLSQLGASVKDDPRITKACSYYLDRLEFANEVQHPRV